MITHLEMTTAEAIRRKFGITDDWKDRPNENRRVKLEDRRNKAKVADSWVDDLLLTQFADTLPSV
jgi:hypothetical protein